jgi:hypothetical protein
MIYCIRWWSQYAFHLSLQDLVDSDALLDADDLKKPDAASLKAPSCGDGTTKKKKACKNW